MSNVKKRRLKKWQIVLLVLISILLLLFIVFISFYDSKLSKLNFDRNEVVSVNTEVTLENEDGDVPDLPSKKDDGKIKLPEIDVFKDKNVFNILLLGTDERTADFNIDARADSIMILSVNKKENTAKLVSLARGIGVPIEGRNDDLLTHTFRYGGANLTMKTVRECFNVDVDRYVRVNFNTFTQIFDYIGGVDIELTEIEVKALNNEVYTNAVTKNRVHKGLNHLDGYDALQYTRLRYTDSDWVRVKRQRTTIQAAVNKTKNMNLVELNNFADTVLPLIQTNLTKGEITSLLFETPAFLGVEIEQKTIPETGTYWGKTGVDGRRMMGIDFKKNADILNQFLYN